MIRKIVFFTTLIVMLLSTKVNASEMPVHHVKDTIVQHSVSLGVDPALALSIAKVESGYNHAKKSRYGAIGVFQLMPSTATKLGINPYLLSDNIKGGILYYKMMYKMFGSTELALAAYNAGPTYILKYHKAPSYTKPYVSQILKEYKTMKTTPILASATKPQPGKNNAQSQTVLLNSNTTTLHGAVKPMSASVPRVINDGNNRLIIKQAPSEKNIKPLLQVSMGENDNSQLAVCQNL